MASTNTSGAIARITREIAAAHRSNDLSIAVAHRDEDVRKVRALIIGPPDTPYEFGFFEFEMKFPDNYPIHCPAVKAKTTNGGNCRFNPNIYANGKVCLSILGTWLGEPGEQWSSAQGLESVLVSIQSLMSSNPYENEPSFEDAQKDEPEPSAYIAKIRHETLRISVLKRLEEHLGIKHDDYEIDDPVRRPKWKSNISPDVSLKQSESSSCDSPLSVSAQFDFPSMNPPVVPAEGPPSPGFPSLNLPSSSAIANAFLHANFTSDDTATPYDADAESSARGGSKWDPFIDLIKRRFLWYHDTYLHAITTRGIEHADGSQFKRMPFEDGRNAMKGHFDYTNLKRRLAAVHAKLSEEPREWLVAGAEQVAAGSQLAAQLTYDFKRLRDHWNSAHVSGSRMEIRLPLPQNPFQWQLCLFGDPLSNLDGGVWNINLHIPPTFPDEQPRVAFETPIFHHRVSSSGVLCYFPEKAEEIGSHLDAIFAAIEDKNATYDPRAMVHMEAFTLYWGGDDMRKTYSRRLRRSAQDSCEYV